MTTVVALGGNALIGPASAGPPPSSWRTCARRPARSQPVLSGRRSHRDHARQRAAGRQRAAPPGTGGRRGAGAAAVARGRADAGRDRRADRGGVRAADRMRAHARSGRSRRRGVLRARRSRSGPSTPRSAPRELERDRGWAVVQRRRARLAPGRSVARSRSRSSSSTRSGRCSSEARRSSRCGGGGHPGRRPRCAGVDAVIDKDRASALLASALGAERLLILTAVPAVYRGFGTPEQEELRELSVDEAERLLAELPEGSMRPKVEAAAAFAPRDGRRGPDHHGRSARGRPAGRVRNPHPQLVEPNPRAGRIGVDPRRRSPLHSEAAATSKGAIPHAQTRVCPRGCAPDRDGASARGSERARGRTRVEPPGGAADQLTIRSPTTRTSTRSSARTSPTPSPSIANYVPLEEPAGGPNFNKFGDDVDLRDQRRQHRRRQGGHRRTSSASRRRSRNPNTFLYNTGPINTLTRSRLEHPPDATRSARPRTSSKGSYRTSTKVLGRNLPTPPVNIGPRSTPNYGALAQAAAVTTCPAGSRSSPASVTTRSSSTSARCSTWPACGRSTRSTTCRCLRRRASTAWAATTRTRSSSRSRSRS